MLDSSLIEVKRSQHWAYVARGARWDVIVSDEQFLREQAERCRRLAGSLVDAKAVAAMRELGVEYDLRADALEEARTVPARSSKNNGV